MYALNPAAAIAQTYLVNYRIYMRVFLGAHVNDVEVTPPAQRVHNVGKRRAASLRHAVIYYEIIPIAAASDDRARHGGAGGVDDV